MNLHYRVAPPEFAGEDFEELSDEAGVAASNPLSCGLNECETREHFVSVTQHGVRLDKLLAHLIPEFSRNYLQSLIEGGHVRVQGAVELKTARKLQVGQGVAVTLVPTPESRAFTPEPLPLNVVYEDATLLVIDKAVGMVVHPAAGNWQGTVLNAVLSHHPASASLPRAGIVHRLDKNTSGLMVLGKTLEAVTALSRAIAAREVHRQYLALAHGDLVKPQIDIECRVGRDPVSRVKMAVVQHGREAKTTVIRLGAVEGVCAVRCLLHTGRTHQIRVHLASMGHPLVGDTVYGGKPYWGITRQALHAHFLEFKHPHHKQIIRFESVLPDDLTEAWARVTVVEKKLI
jgi:23S rRNA pseudouridine1911/1915/1917 synthase